MRYLYLLSLFSWIPTAICGDYLSSKLSFLLDQTNSKVLGCHPKIDQKNFCDQQYFCQEFKDLPGAKINGVFLYQNNKGESVPNYQALNILEKTYYDTAKNTLEKTNCGTAKNILDQHPTLKYLSQGNAQQHPLYHSYVTQSAQTYNEVMALASKELSIDQYGLTFVIPQPNDQYDKACQLDMVVSIDRETKQIKLCSQFLILPKAALSYYLLEAIIEYSKEDVNPLFLLAEHWDAQNLNLKNQTLEAMSLVLSQVCMSPSEKFNFLQNAFKSDQNCPEEDYLNELWFKDHQQGQLDPHHKRLIQNPKLRKVFQCRESPEVGARK